MDKPKGGRGHVAPYETKQMRVPVKLEPQIHELIDRFRNWIANSCPGGIGLSEPPKLLDKAAEKLKVECETLEQEVNQLHSANGELHLKVAELEEQLKLVNKLVENDIPVAFKPVDRLTSKIKLEAIILLQNAIVPKTKGGSYDASNATGLKKTVKQVLKLLELNS